MKKKFFFLQVIDGVNTKVLVYSTLDFNSLDEFVVWSKKLCLICNYEFSSVFCSDILSLQISDLRA